LALKRVKSGFVRFPTKPDTVSQKSLDPPPTAGVCVAFAARQGWFQVGTVIADRGGSLRASLQPFQPTNQELS